MPRGERLLQSLKDSKADVGSRTLDRLYTSFGFDKREGGKHIIYFHPRYPWLQASVSRKKKGMAIGHVTTAIKLVEKTKALDTTK